MFITETRYTESCNTYSIAKGAHAISFDVVTKFKDRVYYGQVRHREIVDIAVEGDLPLSIKTNIRQCLLAGRSDEARRWAETHLYRVIALGGVS